MTNTQLDIFLLVGIDFGTTYTLISKFNNNKSELINDGICNMIPTKIGFYNNKFYYGNYIPKECNNIVTNFKLNIGESINYIYNDKTLTNNDLLVYFFRYLYSIIKSHVQDHTIIKCVITVPSNFTDIQRKILKFTLEYIGFIVIRIINEPSAAAIAYGLNYSSNIEEKILVVDIGGGTTDITILQKTDLFFEVIHSEGINIGGNDLTDIIYNDILIECNIDKIENMNIWNIAENIKKKLSYIDLYKININNYIYSLSSLKFNQLIQNFIIKLEELILNIVNEYNDINYVILVGGTNKISYIQNKINNIIKNKIWIYPNLEYAVVEGACLYAGIIENKFINTEDIVLLDVLPLSLGIELADSTYSIVIPKNTPLPVKRNQKYTTNTPNNKTIKFKVYQGERTIANKNILLAEIIFEKISIGCMPIIDIEFKVDINSIIYITVKDIKTDNYDIHIIKDNYITNINTDIQIYDYDPNDETILLKLRTLYQINIFIENCLHNININNLLSDNDKNNIINKLLLIEQDINNKSTPELLKILNILHNDYNLIK